MSEPVTTPAPHALPASTLVSSWTSDTERGLSPLEHQQRLQQWGPNTLPGEQSRPLAVRLAREFANPLTAVLALAVALTIYLGDYVDSVVIAVVIVINAMIGFAQEYRAERALQHVSRLLAPHATVIRDGLTVDVEASSLVPGDIVVLGPGVSITADARLLHVESLETDESTLTGESTPVVKSVDPVAADTSLADRTNMVFAGTIVTRGTARALVVATGTHTELGAIGSMMRSVGRLRTPLTRRLDRLAQQITIAVVAISTLTLAWGLWVANLPFDFLFIAIVGLAVGAIPEGLPAVISFALASSAKALADFGVLVRRLPAVEALGSVTVVFTDKTGTLTRNEMTVVSVLTAEAEHAVSGVGYHPTGAIESMPEDRDAPAWQALRGGALCNDARLDHNGAELVTSGDPTELALLTLAAKAGLDLAQLTQDAPRLGAIPFDADNQFMATLHQWGKGQMVVVKGSPEKVLELCRDADPELDSALWTERIDREAKAGHRMLLIAVARGDSLSLDDLSTLPLAPVGAVALIDPPQPEAIEAIAQCQRAGVRVVMVTGDHPHTASAIARELGFADEVALIGSEIDQMSDSELSTRLRDTAVVARATPAHKLRLVTLAQDQGEFVAMTGDGVNDAPALRQAHIGVAMGTRGTDVAKEAADIVLTDDRFATLVHGIREGRRVFDNIKKSLLFLLSTDLDEAVLIILAILFGLSLPVTPTQILWVNLVTSVTLSFALILEKAEPSLMRRGPNPKSLSLITRAMLARILLVSTFSVIATFSVFWWQLGAGVALAEAQTAAVTMLVVVEVAILLNHRNFTRSALRPHSHQSNRALLVVLAVLALVQLGFVYLPVMHDVFGSAPLPGSTWLVIGLLALGVFALIEVEKLIRRTVFHQEVF